MPILVQTVVNQCAAALDAEGSDRYLFDQDYRPGIRYALDMITASLNDLFAERKLAPEALVELTRTRVWQTDAYSRFSFYSPDLPNNEEWWTLITVHPKAVCVPQGPILVLPDDQSKVRLDLMYKSSDWSAARKTWEEASINKDNPFAAGNSFLTNTKLVTYSVLDASSYKSANYNPNGTFVYEITPAVPKELIGVRYLKKPVYPALISDSIEFRDTALNMIVDLVLKFISFKQGDQTNLYGVTSVDRAELMKIFGR